MPADLKGGDAVVNAAALREVLAGKRNAFRDAAIMTAGAALVVAERAKTLKEGTAQAAEAIDSGKAQRALERLVDVSRETTAR